MSKTPPVQTKRDRLPAPDKTAQRLEQLRDARALVATEHSRHLVRRSLALLERKQGARPGLIDPVAIDRAHLVDLILELVQVAIEADRTRQREMLHEVQLNLPTSIAIDHALGAQLKAPAKA